MSICSTVVNQTPIISIIIPAYNAEKTLKKCLDSILDQANTAIEVIVSDDGSTDSTQSIIQDYIACDSRVKGIKDTNGGLSCARNRGTKIATGRWVTFVDADDYVSPGIYSKIAKVLTVHQPDMLDYQFSVVINGNNYLVPHNCVPKDILLDRSWMTENIIPVLINVSDKKEYFIENYVCNKVYKRDLIIRHNVLFDETRRKWEDRLFSVTFLQYAHTYYSMSDYGYHYVQHGNTTLSGRFDASILRIIMDSYEKYRGMYAEKYDFDGEYTVDYFCSLLLETAVQQFSFGKERAILEDMFNIFIESQHVQQLFEQFVPKNQFTKDARSAVLSRDIDALYSALEKQHYENVRTTASKARFNYLRNLLSKIKHSFFK